MRDMSSSHRSPNLRRALDHAARKEAALSRFALPRIFVCLALLTAGMSWPAGATGGRTDKYGCHTSRTAGYHCHGEKGDKTPSSGAFNRDAWGFRSYKSNVRQGYYTGKTCDAVDIDHVVSLRDAHDSGGAVWPLSRKQTFANDRQNHVPACAAVNRSKGASGPADFFRKASDGRGRDYRIIRKCDYLRKYVSVKAKYALEISRQAMRLHKACP